MERRGQVCPLGMLEGLVDAELKEPSAPGIKQQLSRMKKRLREVDAGFDSGTARQVFQSVSGVGYMLRLPPQGEVLEVNTPVDEMVAVDMKFLKCQRAVSEEEIENLKNIFYGITGDRKVIMQAVCNNLHVSGAQYQKLADEFASYVFEQGKPAGPVYLMADGGTGKSTLLCDFAVRTAFGHPGWNVYYLDISVLGSREENCLQVFDYMRQNGISRTRKNVLCIDSSHENPKGFQKLYQILLDLKIPYLYVVVAERAFLMLSLLESNAVFQRNSYIRGFYIDNGNEESAEAFRTSYVQFSDLKRYPFPQELKEEIAGKIIPHFCAWKKLDMRIAEQSMSGISFDNKTISDIFLKFKSVYNRMAETKDYYIPRIDMDWDEWKARCRPLDADCSRLKMSEVFPYIAAYALFGIKVVYEFIREMTGYPYKSEFLRLFPEGLGECIQYKDGHLVLRHDTVAGNYFSCHPEIPAQSCMEELIAQGCINEEVCEKFTLIALRIYTRHNPNVWPYGMDLRKLLRMFRNNRKYMEIMDCSKEKWMAELLSVMLYDEPGMERGDGRLTQAVSDAFARVMDGGASLSNKAVGWYVFFIFAAERCAELPEALLYYLTELNSKDVKWLMGFLEDTRVQYNILKDEQWNKRYLRYCKAVYEKVIEERMEMSKDVSVLLMEIYMEKGDEEEIKSLMSKLEGCNCREDDEVSLEWSREFLSAVYQMKCLIKNPKRDQKQILEHWKKFEPFVGVFLPRIEDDYVNFQCIYASFDIVCRRFDDCYARLEGAMAQATGRNLKDVYVALGRLYEADPEENPYYTLEGAAECYAFVLELELKDADLFRQIQLIPLRVRLINVLFELGRYEEALLECISILKIRPDSPKIVELALKIINAMEDT